MNLMRAQFADRAVSRAKAEILKGNSDLAWKSLEEAHIFAQSEPGMHLYVHWQMLLLAFGERTLTEIFGQTVRFLVAAPSSILRVYPVGNTGRSSVGLFSPMPLSKRHEKKLRELDVLEKRRIDDGGKLKKYQRQHPITRR